MVIKDKRPLSSFLSVEKDINLIVDKLFENKRLQRLLYYNTPDALEKPNLNKEQLIEVFQKHIKVTPKILVDNELRNYLIIRFDDFLPNGSNPEFRNNLIQIIVICHFDQWELNNFQQRPYKIAGEIDSMLNGEKLTGIGRLEFLGMSQIVPNSEFSGFILSYLAIHGEEDKTPMPNPIDQERFEEEFREMMESLND